jgi:WD40 repeat protein
MPRYANASAASGCGSALPSEAWARLEPVLERFEEAWRRGERPALDDYLAAAAPEERHALLIELVHEDLDYRLKAGEAARVETYLVRYPGLAADGTAVLALIAAEYELRRRGEGGVKFEDYQHRFPQHAEDLLQCLQTVSYGGATPHPAAHCGVSAREGVSAVTPDDPRRAGEEDTPGLPQPTQPGEKATANLPSVPGYEILGVLGRGGMGVVYKARQIRLNRLVALKMILAGSHAGERELARFRSEAEAVARLQHPNFVQIYEVGEWRAGDVSPPMPFFSLEFCEGGSLDKKLGGTPMAPPQAAELVEKLARAMHAAHQKEIVHRDLKPANVLLATDGTPKIADFGLAKKLDEAGQTASDAILGTPSYMAPEQAGGKSKEVGPLADVYALGAILYECLTGRPPFRAAAPLDTLHQVLSDEPVPPRMLQPNTPRDLETVCLKCLQKEPARRYASALALAEDLRRYRAGEPIQARPVRALERFWRWCRRNPAVASASGVAAFLLLATLVTLLGAVILINGSRDQALALAENNARLAQEKGELADAERDQRQTAEQQRRKAERRLAENYVNLALFASDKKEFRRGMLLLVRALELCPADAQDLRNQIRASLARFSLEFPHLEAILSGQATDLPDLTHGGVAAFSPDGTRMIAPAPYNKALLWDARSGKILGNPLDHPLTVLAVAFSPDGHWCITGCSDGNARVWDLGFRKVLLTLPHGRGVTAVAISPDGKTILTGGEDKMSRLWSLPRGVPVAPPLPHDGTVVAVAFSPDGKSFLTGSVDGKVRIGNTATGELVGKALVHPAEVLAAAYSPDGSEILTGCKDLRARFWNVAGRQPTGQEFRHPDLVRAVAYSPDGKLILTGCANHQGFLWDRVTGQSIGEPLEEFSEVQSVGFSRDGETLWTSSYFGTRLWSLTPPRILRHGEWVAAVAFSPDGRLILTGSAVILSRTGKVRLWDAGTGAPMGEPLPSKYMVMSVAFSPDGSRFATGSGNLNEVPPSLGSAGGEAQLWDTATRKPIGSPLNPGGSVPSVAFSPGDGKYLLTADMGHDRAQLWETATGKLIRSFPQPAHVVAVAFSPDGKRIATGPYGSDERVLLWETETGKLCGQFQHRSIVPGLAFSPDGKSLLTGSGDYLARLWDVQQPEHKPTTFTHKQWVRPVAFHPRDPRIILTGSGDQTARLWDIQSRNPIGPPLRHEGMVFAAAFSPDGKTILTGSLDGTARLWNGLVPVEGDLDRIKLWAQVITGMELDDLDATHVLETSAWKQRREQLAKGPGVARP